MTVVTVEPVRFGRCTLVVHSSNFPRHTMHPVGLASRTPVQFIKPTSRTRRRYTQQTLATIAVRSYNACQCIHSQIHYDCYMPIIVLLLQFLYADVQCIFVYTHTPISRKSWRSTLAFTELDELGRLLLFCNRWDFGCRYGSFSLKSYLFDWA